MVLTFADVDLKVDLPKIPRTAPVVRHAPPCLKEQQQSMRLLAKELNIEARGTAQLPHGFAVGSDGGQVEVFAASGAVRARSTEQITAYPDERRDWSDLDRDRDGTFHLGPKMSDHLITHGLEILRRTGIADEHARADVVLGQWARLDEDGTEVESGPGRATVRLSYAVDGLQLIGAGAKTNLHLDPEDGGRTPVLARMFHVHRATEAVGEVVTLPVEEAFAELLTQTWSGYELVEKARMTVTAATFGLLALPADVVQSFAAPALMVEGEVSGVDVGKDQPVTVRFGHYLPLASPEALAAAGYGGGPLVPGTVAVGTPREKAERVLRRERVRSPWRPVLPPRG